MPSTSVRGDETPTDRRDEMRAEIATVAARLFAERGYAATTMLEIAECFRFSKAALYHYVTSKEEVLGLVADRALSLLEEGLERSRAEQATCVDRLRAIIGHHVDVASHDTRALFVLEAIRGELSGEQQAALRRRADHYREGLAQLIIEGQRAGELAADLDPHLTSLGILGMCSWVAWWFDPTGKSTPERIAEVFERLCIGGVRAPAAETRAPRRAVTRGVRR